MKIREAKLTDLQVIKELNLKLFEKEYKDYDKTLNMDWTFSKKGDKYFKDCITKDDCFAIVAIDSDKIIGYLAGSISKPEFYRAVSKLAEMDNMIVLPEYRNKGIGTKLINEFIKWCKKKKVERATVTASYQNKLAINFYKKNNFKEYDTVLELEL
ncbi:GNAT family N-acetyltransferase [Candidatus Woesearchaeota archaeon]|jgi:ribosomal protein S18 acetylase RimI-like enzyme|nr:GNAT family N-acetyltransferase [Candidatus Woesearchaeota archaeon]MBT7062988.1 GNAT family N-acetyltransferase [Candidatus Woesearchaeota archaeon]MBT7402805.1 GNAT family N-acetyltransferase [Candidatus Woesearchaeota archaeon]